MSSEKTERLTAELEEHVNTIINDVLDDTSATKGILQLLMSEITSLRKERNTLLMQQKEDDKDRDKLEAERDELREQNAILEAEAAIRLNDCHRWESEVSTLSRRLAEVEAQRDRALRTCEHTPDYICSLCASSRVVRAEIEAVHATRRLQLAKEALVSIADSARSHSAWSKAEEALKAIEEEK